MKIALIGPGIMPIPPNNWGAVESLIWDQYEYLKEKGIHVIYADLPTERQRDEFSRVATYPITFLDEYFGKETPTVQPATTPPSGDLIYLLGRLEAIEKQFAELIKKLDNVTNSNGNDDDLPF